MAEVTKFEQAIDEAGYGFSQKNVTETHETIEHFLAARGKPQVVDTENGTLHIWENVQQAKGLVRGSLIVMDAGDTRFVHFDGQKI
jgi:hypothetical protein